MEIHQYALPQLISQFTNYSSTSLSHFFSFQSTIKKRNVLSPKGHFSLFVNILDLEDQNDLQKEIQRLKEESKRWSLQVEEVFVRGNLLSLKLARSVAFRTVFRDIFSSKGAYGLQPVSQSKATITGLFIQAESLTELRINLLVGVAKNLLEAVGYKIEDSDGDGLKIHYSTQTPASPGAIQCHPITISNGHLSIEEFYKLREDDVRVRSDTKHWDQEASPTIKAIAKAAVAYDLLRIKPNQNVPKDGNSREAPFVLYNYVRMRAIQRKYESCVDDGVYDPLPKLDDIDTNLLNHEEEWQILFDYLLEYPIMLSNIVKNAANGEIHQNTLCHFLMHLSHCFSNYYGRVRILQEPKPHLMPTLHARLMLIKAAEEVIKYSFKILNIVPVERM